MAEEDLLLLAGGLNKATGWEATLTIDVVRAVKRDQRVPLNGGREPAVTYQIIRQAIVDRRCVSALYDDYVRVFCPRTIGKDQAGAEIVEAFQYGGGCPGGLPLGGKWCCFRVSDIDLISIYGDAWRAGTSGGKGNGWVTDVDVAS